MSLLEELQKLPADALITGSAETIARGDATSDVDVLGKMLRYPGLGQFIVGLENGLYYASAVPNPDMSVAGASRVMLGIVEAADIQEVEARTSNNTTGRLHEELADLRPADYDKASGEVANEPQWLVNPGAQRATFQAIPAFDTLASDTRRFSNTVPDFRDGENLLNGALLAMQYVIAAGTKDH